MCVWFKTTQGFYCSKMPQVAPVLNSASPPSSVDASHGEAPQGPSMPNALWCWNTHLQLPQTWPSNVGEYMIIHVSLPYMEHMGIA